LTVLVAARSAGGAQAQPIFHPVTLNDLPALPMVTVLSRIPGSVAIGMCSCPSKVRCSYTSSAITVIAWRRACSAIMSSSARLNTLPVGLCGVLSKIALVRGLIASAKAAGSNDQPDSPRCSVTVRRVAPPRATQAAYES